LAVKIKQILRLVKEVSSAFNSSIFF